MAGTNQTQTITVNYVATQAQKDAAKFAADEQKRTRETADVAKKAAKEVADAQKKAAKESADEAKKAAKEKEKAEKEAAKAIVANEKATAAERKAAEEVLLKWSTREYRDRVNKQIADAKRLAAEEKKAALDAQLVKVKAAAAAAAASRAAAAASAKQWATQNDAIMGSVKSVGMFAASMVGLSGTASILSKIVEHFNAVRMAAILSGDDLIKYAKELRSLGALEGNLGAPETTLAGQLSFRAKTLQTPADAAEMTKAALASAQGAMDSGLVKPDVFKSFLTSQGQLQTMLGESPTAIGNVAGSIPMMIGKKNVSLEEMQSMSEKARLLAKGGGFDSYEQAAVQLGKVMPWVTSGMLSMPEAMTLLSVEAHGGQGAEAGTRIDEMVRMVSMGRIRAKKMKLDPSVADESQVSSEYMKSVGIGEQTSTYDRAKKIAQDLMRQDQAAMAKGEIFNPVEYLGEHGQINMASNFAATHMFGQMKIGAFEPLEAEAQKVQDPLAQTKAFEEFKRSSITAQSMEAGIAEEQVDVLRGLQKGEPFKKTMMKKAYASLGPKASDRTFDSIYNAGILDPYGMYKRSQLEEEAQRLLVEEGARTGAYSKFDYEQFKAGKGVRGYGKTILGADRAGRPGTMEGLGVGFMGWEGLEDLSRRNVALGGSATPAMDASKMEGLLKEIRDELRALNGAPGRPAAPGAAPAPKPLVMPAVKPPAPAARP